MSENAATTGWYDRLLDERLWLVGNIEKLRAFIGSDGFLGLDYANQTLLHRQFTCMGRYLDVLDERITLNAPENRVQQTT
jgi:hypothetical protein